MSNESETVSMKLHDLAGQLKLDSGIQSDLPWVINTFMAEFLLNDCQVPHSIPPRDPFGHPLTLTHHDWEHPLHSQVITWPISHLIGIIPSRLEHEWNEELTSSGDLDVWELCRRR